MIFRKNHIFGPIYRRKLKLVSNDRQKCGESTKNIIRYIYHGYKELCEVSCEPEFNEQVQNEILKTTVHLQEKASINCFSKFNCLLNEICYT